MHRVIDSHLGETAKCLAKVFEQIRKTRAIYFFDEIDGLAARRSGGGDGVSRELNRAVNSFLQFLDRDRSDSIIVAATNLSDIIDRAFLRRFDVVLHFTRPDASQAANLACDRLSALRSEPIDWLAIGRSASRLSHSEILSAANLVGKAAVMSGDPITQRRILDELDARVAAHETRGET